MAVNYPQEKLLTGARQTMQSWVKPIESFAEIPPACQPKLRALLGNEADFPYIVFSPPVSGSHVPQNERLLIWFDKTLYVLENKDEKVELTGFKKEEFGYLETGKVLLYSWFALSGITTEGESRTLTVVYNTATHRHIEPLLDELRSLPARKRFLERSEFNYLLRENFKFYNFANKSLRADEKVFGSISQREITRSGSIPFFQTSQPALLVTAHLAIVTELEMIFIEEDPDSQQRNGNRYGVIWHFIPLEKIISVTQTDREDGLFMLSFLIAPDTTIERIYSERNRAKAIKLKDKLETLLNSHSKI